MSINRRQAIATGAIAAVIAVGGGTWWYLQEDEPKGASDRIDLLAGAYSGPPHLNDPELYVMLTITGGMPEGTGLEVRFFDLDGNALPPLENLTASLTNLVTGEVVPELSLVEIDRYAQALEQDTIESDGWWQVRLNAGDLEAYWTFLMPDPNLTGFDTPPVIDSEPEADAMLTNALAVLKSRKSVRFWEWLSGGNGAIILARFSVTTPESNGLPPSFESDSMMAGRIPMDGTAPSFRSVNPRTVTVGDEALRYVGDATPEAANPTQYLPIEEYDSTYEGFDGAHFGMTAEIDGVECQLVAFHLPSTTESWFAFWIEIETATLRELFMHSVNHYMHWVYHDLDEPFELTLDT